jgi:hypothetical protein
MLFDLLKTRHEDSRELLDVISLDHVLLFYFCSYFTRITCYYFTCTRGLCMLSFIVYILPVTPTFRRPALIHLNQHRNQHRNQHSLEIW